MTYRHRFSDKPNGIKVEEHDHTVRISVQEPVHLTPAEASSIAAALIVAAGNIEERKIPKHMSSQEEKSIFTLGGALIAAACVSLVALSSPVRAQGACGAIQDFERRQICIAIQDANPAECASIKDMTDRALCRIKAQNRQDLRDAQAFPRNPR